MIKTLPIRCRRIAVLLTISAGCLMWGPAAVSAQEGDNPQFKGEFLKLCDAACEELKLPNHGVVFFRESYVIRALAVAYDMTGKTEYLDACRAWSDRMIAFQEKMTPAGAYFMNYGRKPSETKGDWYVADSASIAMGVLATARRCSDGAQRRRYMDSVRAYAKLVMDNYVRPSGGVTDGIWPLSDREWWCSTGTFVSVAFLLYQETGEEAYRNAALHGIDWLNDMDFKTAGPFTFDKFAATIVMYVFEGYSAGLRYLEPGTQRYAKALAQIDRASAWITESRQTRFTECEKNPLSWWAKSAGLPFHMYVWARHLPDGAKLVQAADQELVGIGGLLAKAKKKPDMFNNQVMVFALMSYAERIRPGALYR
jgi:hypothetical protein